MHAECSVPPIKNCDPIEFLNRSNDCLLVVFIATVHDKIATKNGAADIKTVESSDVSTSLTNGGTQPSEGAGHVVELTVKRNRKCSVGKSRHKTSYVTDLVPICQLSLN